MNKKQTHQSLALMQSTLKFVGLDPSLRNWGTAVGSFNLETKELQIQDLNVTCPELSRGKQVRQNSLDLEAAFQLYKGAIAAAVGAHAVFVEVPVGSQSARAMASYGICVGVLGALRANGIPFFEVTPNEVKLAGPGDKAASKKMMIEWAMNKHPEANWPLYLKKGISCISEAKAEHQADAVAAIYAGICCNAFQQLLPFLVPKH